MARFLPVLALVGALTSGALAAPILDDPVVVVPPTVSPSPPAVVPAPAAASGGPTTPPGIVPVSRLAGPPFTGAVRVDGVYVRGGPSKNHFPVGRLARGAEVEVLRQTFDWYQIKPPAGVFCWIHKNYVTLDATGKAGVVTGDNVNVRGDSIQGHDPVKSDVVDRLSKGAHVTVVGTQGDWLRIEPPATASVFVSAGLVTPRDGEMAVAAVEPGAGADETLAPAATAAEDALDRAEQAYRTERLKKPAEWDLAKLTGLYRDVQANTPDERTKAIAENRLAYLDQLAKVREAIADVERGRQEARARLDAERQRLLAEEAARREAKTADEVTYAISGVLDSLHLPDGKPRFKLVDPDNRQQMLCVVEGTVEKLTPLIGRRVGIQGEFRLSPYFSVKVIQAEVVTVIRSPDETRTAQPPAPAATPTPEN
jgi:SH3-like domain-containing protein